VGNQTPAYVNFRSPPPSVDELIARLAARQHGLVAYAQLVSLGLDRKSIARRVAQGRLHRVARGVYAVGHVALSREAEFLAAVLEAGKGAALSHLAVAEHWEVRKYRAPLIDVVVPSRRRVKTATRIHRTTLHPSDVTQYKGIPVTTIARMLVDLTDVLDAHDLTNVIHEAEFRHRFSERATREAMERANGRHNLKRLERALELRDEGSAGLKSRNEATFLSMLKNLPEPLVNVKLNGEEVDFHWPRAKLAVEVDGPGHERERTRREDARKEAAWRAAGYEVLRVTDLREGLIRLRAALERRPPAASA
jgi:very-short-patch-repair endonuclease